MSNDLKTFESNPYEYSHKPEMFRDDLDLTSWLADKDIDEHLKKELIEKGVAALVPLLDGIAELSREARPSNMISPDSWFKFRTNRDKRGDFRVVTPEFQAPPTELTEAKATRLYVFPPSEHFENGFVAVEKRANYWGEDQIFRGHEMLWTPREEELRHLGIRDREDRFIDLMPDVSANEDHRNNAIKNIVAAYVELKPVNYE